MARIEELREQREVLLTQLANFEANRKRAYEQTKMARKLEREGGRRYSRGEIREFAQQEMVWDESIARATRELTKVEARLQRAEKRAVGEHVSPFDRDFRIAG
jgi:hypothetical protein